MSTNLKAKIYSPAKKLAFSRTAQNTFILSSADLGLAFLAAVTTAIIARNLSPTDFGTFIALWTFLTLVSALLDLGVGAGIIAFVADTPSQEKKNHHIGAALTFLFLIGLGQFILIFSGVNLLQILLFPEVNAQLIRLTAVGSWLLILGRFANDALRAKQEFIKTGIATSLFALLRLGFILWAVVSHRLTLPTSILIMALSPAIYFALGYYFLKLPWRNLGWDRSLIKNLLGFAGWLGVNQVVSTISGRVDVLLLNRLAGALSAGIYGTASLMARVFVIITASLSAVFAPRLIQLRQPAHQKKFLAKMLLVVIAGWLGLAATGLLARPLITFIFGSQYLEALHPFYFLLLAMAALMATLPVTLPVIYLMKKPQIIAYLSLGQLVVIALGNLILIPKLGFLAPPILLFISQLLVVAVGGWYTMQWLSQSNAAIIND